MSHAYALGPQDLDSSGKMLLRPGNTSKDKADFPEDRAYVLSVFPLCAPVPRVQGSSGAVATVQFVWRGLAKTPTTRAGPRPDFSLRLE